jgi:hypothetical protein
MKNRFAKPSLSGYRDVNLHVRVDCKNNDSSFFTMFVRFRFTTEPSRHWTRTFRLTDTTNIFEPILRVLLEVERIGWKIWKWLAMGETWWVLLWAALGEKFRWTTFGTTCNSLLKPTLWIRLGASSVSQTLGNSVAAS